MKRTFNKRLASLFVALAVVFSVLGGSIPAMAAETEREGIDNGTLTSQDEVDVEHLRSEIDALIGKNNPTRDYYLTDYWGHVTFTNTNTGAWHTIYGHQARIAVAFKPLDGNDCLALGLSSGFWGWNISYAYNAVDSDGYYMYVGPWCDITYQGVYRLIYQAWTYGNGGVLDGRTVSCHVWVDYK